MPELLVTNTYAQARRVAEYLRVLEDIPARYPDMIATGPMSQALLDRIMSEPPPEWDRRNAPGWQTRPSALAALHPARDGRVVFWLSQTLVDLITADWPNLTSAQKTYIQNHKLTVTAAQLRDYQDTFDGEPLWLLTDPEPDPEGLT